MTRTRWAVLAVFVALIAAFFAFDAGRFFSLDYFKSSREGLLAYRDAHPLLAAGGFFLLYVTVTGLSVPGAAILTLAAGAVFGLLWGTLLVSFASSIGATLAFLTSRFILRDAIQRRYGEKLRAVNDGVARDGAFYLFTLRVVPLFPFFIVNLVMGVTPIAVATFYLVSQAGMLPATIVYVLAGTQIAQITSLRGILSPGLVGAFVLLGLFPLIARKTMDYVKGRRRGFQAEKI